jgi:hypothetical protein
MSDFLQKILILHKWCFSDISKEGTACSHWQHSSLYHKHSESNFKPCSVMCYILLTKICNERLRLWVHSPSGCLCRWKMWIANGRLRLATVSWSSELNLSSRMMLWLRQLVTYKLFSKTVISYRFCTCNIQQNYSLVKQPWINKYCIIWQDNYIFNYTFIVQLKYHIHQCPLGILPKG